MRGSCRLSLSLAAHPNREYLRVPFWLFFNKRLLYLLSPLPLHVDVSGTAKQNDASSRVAPCGARTEPALQVVKIANIPSDLYAQVRMVCWINCRISVDIFSFNLRNY